jgi:predicted RNase H-like HicB family nuclease
VLAKYIQAAMRRAKYEILEDDGSFYGSIPELQGVWANAGTLEECREELESVFEGWLLLGVSLHHPSHRWTDPKSGYLSRSDAAVRAHQALAFIIVQES